MQRKVAPGCARNPPVCPLCCRPSSTRTSAPFCHFLFFFKGWSSEIKGNKGGSEHFFDVCVCAVAAEPQARAQSFWSTRVKLQRFLPPVSCPLLLPVLCLWEASRSPTPGPRCLDTNNPVTALERLKTGAWIAFLKARPPRGDGSLLMRLWSTLSPPSVT